MTDWASRGRFKTQSETDELEVAFADAFDLAEKGDLDRSLRRLERLRQMLRQNRPAILDP